LKLRFSKPQLHKHFNVRRDFFPQKILSAALIKVPKFGNFDKFLIMSRNTSISLGNHFEDFVDERVSTGRFKNASEVIRAGLRLLEEKESKIVVLKKAIDDGLKSGIAKDFNVKDHLATLKANKKKNG